MKKECGNLKTGMWKKEYTFCSNDGAIRMVQQWNICLEMFTVVETACY